MGEQLKTIMNDTTHGSTYIAKELLSYFKDNKFDNKISNKIKSQFSDMQIISNVLDRLERADHPREEASILLDQLSQSTSKIIRKFSDYLDNHDISSILTFSHSNTVENVLKKLNLNIYSMVSQPGGEGKELAANIDGKVIDDESGLDMIRDEQIDLVLIGCDQYSDQYFVNKIGTSELIDVTMKNNVDVFILTSHLKYTDNISEIDNELFEICKIESNVTIITDR